MADTRGTWSLSEAWAEKAAAEWVPVPNVWLANAGFGYDKDVAKNIERGIETLSPEGTDFLRVPMTFNTQMIVSTKGSEITRATPLIYEWYTKKRKTLKDAVENQEIKQSV